MSFGGEIVAGELFTALIAGEDFTIPTVDLNDPLFAIPGDITSELYKPVERITNEQLTEQKTDGNGTFDVAMGGFRAQLVKEFNEGRISGAEYTKAFIALAESAMSGAIQFLIARDQAFWQAQSAQANAIAARVGLATAKVQYATAVMQARNTKAEFAVTKLRLANEDAQYGQTKYQIDNLLPAQFEQLGLQNDISTFQRDTMLPLQQAGQETQNDILDYQLNTQMPAQVAMINEQKEAQRAQTLDTRSDAEPVTGLLGKQKDLYERQIISYQRDSEVKAAKLFTDIWTVNKTIDEDQYVPNSVGVAIDGSGELNTLLETIRTNNGLG